MKLKLFITFLFLLSITILLNAQAIYFTTPANGHVFSIPEGQSTANITIDFSYIIVANPTYKLYADPSGNWSKNSYYDIPKNHTLSAGQYTWRVELFGYVPGSGDVKMGEHEITFYVRPTITAGNNFGGGIINVNGLTVNNGYQITPSPGSLTSLEAIEQDFDNYYRLFYTWSGASSASTRSTSVQAPTTSSLTATANFVRQFNVTFENPLSSTNINGQIYYSSSNTVYLRENYQVSASGYSTSANGIDFTFSYWLKNNQTFSSNFYPSDHGTFTAVYTGKPNSGECSITFNTSQEGQPVNLTWSKHPLDNSSISHYAIWRKVTTSGTPTLLTTVSATGASSYNYTDYEFAISSGANKILLFYDVRPYYSPDNSYSDPSFEGVYGVYNTSKQTDGTTQNQSSLELPTTMTVSNYPNPFNPTTTISYQLPEKSFVTLKVFDILGKEVTTLINETKPAGYYQVNFDGSKLTSGVYIYTISANGIVQTKKMLLAK